MPPTPSTSKASSSEHHARQTARRTVLDNGLTVLTETMPTVRSATIGVWLREGSRHEPEALQGIAHFIEHLLFKGTESRTAREIAVEIDKFGGALDAFTSREYACYYARALDDHADTAVDLLADITRHPVFPDEEIERERRVIFEEIKMVDDSPDDLAYDLLYTALWPDHPLGRSIQGTRETVGGIERRHIQEFFAANYVPSNLIVAAAGNLEHDELLDMVSERFGPMREREAEMQDGPPHPQATTVVRPRTDMEQAHLVLGFPAHSVLDERRYAQAVLNTVVGGGMSSRLFQAVREERGLAYAVYSAQGGYKDAGNLSIYAGTSRDTVVEALETIAGELRDIRDSGPTAEELDNAREHLKGSLTLGLESTTNRMSNLARQEIYYDRMYGLDEILEKIGGVTADEIRDCAREIFVGERACLVAVGNVADLDLAVEALEI